jgi:hypothetical protein
MGGIGTLPMDYGQPLQVPQQQQPSFSSAQNITMNPLLNYGQPQLGQAGGTPLTMAGGGMSRLGYQEGGMGMGMEMMQPQMQDPIMQEQMMQSQQMMEPPLQGMEGQQPDIKDPKQALELIIQMLIAQGIPPEQAKEIAIQMVQAVAEGGMEEMGDQRIEARFGGRIGYAGGGIGSLVNREGYFLGSVGKAVGSVFKGAGKLVSGAVNAVKKVASSDLGKAALTIAAIYASGGGAAFGGPGFSFFGTQAGPGLLGSGGAFNLGSSYLGQGLFGVPGADTMLGAEGIGSQGFLGKLGLTSGYGAGANILSGASSLLPGKGTLAAFGLGTTLGGLLGEPPKPEDFPNDEEYQKAVAQYKAQYQAAINNPNPQFAAGQFPNNPFYPQRAANGGRIGYQEGGIGDLVKQVTQQEFFGRPAMAIGGEIPVRQNKIGVKELDYREKGGFVPPIGIKEKADDIPAMLSNNEFVFTADAVRNAGNGSVNKGAERMYGLMKQLEAGGVV